MFSPYDPTELRTSGSQRFHPPVVPKSGYGSLKPHTDSLSGEQSFL